MCMRPAHLAPSPVLDACEVSVVEPREEAGGVSEMRGEKVPPQRRAVSHNVPAACR